MLSSYLHPLVLPSHTTKLSPSFHTLKIPDLLLVLHLYSRIPINFSKRQVLTSDTPDSVGSLFTETLYENVLSLTSRVSHRLTLTPWRCEPLNLTLGPTNVPGIERREMGWEVRISPIRTSKYRIRRNFWRPDGCRSRTPDGCRSITRPLLLRIKTYIICLYHLWLNSD